MKYFGQDCKYLSGMWECENGTYQATYEKQNYEPILTYCNNKKNQSDHEGNCNKLDCPLLKDKYDK